MIQINSIVTYKEPMADEFFPDGSPLTFTVVKIEPETNWCLLMANVDLYLKPTQTANISDIKSI